MTTQESNKLIGEFIPYEQALALKELGFDEPCLKYYSSSANAGDNDFNKLWDVRVLGKVRKGDMVESVDLTNEKSCLAPLYQQAFRWFREKHNLYCVITLKKKGEWLMVVNEYMKPRGMFFRKYYEEAELACLDKLIEIVKE
jgi:hypothetical protein